MKKGTLNIFGRKNQSLFDTNVKIKEMDNVELVLDSPAIPESGTASVRARPTVKHHNSSSFDSFQGFAVPTPKVPLMPPFNGPKINGSVGGDRLSNGSVISIPDLVEGEIFVPPPPSMAPPPPPGTFVPPPDFLGDLNTLDLENLQHPSMKPSFLPLSPGEEEFTSLRPPQMAPPKPPSTISSGSVSSLPISTPPPANVPVHPSFAAPQPPSERQQKNSKSPPPKPIRLSSISMLDSPPQSPAPPPPVQTPAQSTFNPQNTAKLYNIPKTSILSGHEDRDTRPKQMLLLEDSGSVTSSPMLVNVNGKATKVTTPSKPVSKDVHELRESLKIPQISPSPLPEPNTEAKPGTVSAPPGLDKPLHQISPQPQKVNSASVNSESSKDKLEVSPSLSHKYSPILDRKLRNLKSSETNGPREGPVASPLALLMAAKERDKHRSSSQEKNGKKNEQPCASIHQSDLSPNSFIVTPRSSSSSYLTSQDILQESPKSDSHLEHTQTTQTPQTFSSPAPAKDRMPFTSPAFNTMAESSSVTKLVTQKQRSDQSPTKPQSTQDEDDKEEFCLPLLPPPPEFDDLDEIMGPPAFIPPPAPPIKMAPTQTERPPPPPQIQAPPPNHKPPAAPKLPTPDKPKPQVQTKPKVAPPQPPSNLSPSQATLLSILQKKMLEMDNKMAPVKQAESSSDDWGNPLADEDYKVPVVPKATPQSRNDYAVSKARVLDMQELEGKVAKKYQDTSSVKVPTSNGLKSKHKYGMTFTVRPGTKEPITLVSRGEP